MKNFFKTTFLLTLLTLLLIWLGAAIGGRTGVIIAFGFALVLNFVSYWYSDRIVLAMYRAQPASKSQYPALHRIVSNLANVAGLPDPKVYIIPSSSPNAFATGRDPKHAAVAVTQGILEVLSEEELRGVLAHELAHVRNRDILIQTVVATIAGAISMLAYMARWAAIFGRVGGRGRDSGGNLIGILIMSIIAPIVAMLIQLAISRSREYQADASGARICGEPLSLASALRRLSRQTRAIPMREASHNTAHLFIINPLTGGGLARLFSTHPPVEDRVAKLERMTIER